jgi:hypothetical protein
MLPNDRSIWIGEWYFLPPKQPPRLVGVFKGHRPNAVGLSPPPKEPPECPKDAKKTVLQKLDKLLEIPEMEQPKWNPHHINGPILDIHYVKNWLQPAEAKEIERKIQQTSDWERMATRDTQEFGSGGRCACGRGCDEGTSGLRCTSHFFFDRVARHGGYIAVFPPFSFWRLGFTPGLYAWALGRVADPPFLFRAVVAQSDLRRGAGPSPSGFGGAASVEVLGHMTCELFFSQSFCSQVFSSVFIVQLRLFSIRIMFVVLFCV